jgi:hypothetical protein
MIRKTVERIKQQKILIAPHLCLWMCMGSAMVALALGGQSAAAADQAIDFSRDIRPILSDTCFNCHGPDANKRKAKLHLDDQNSVFTKRDGIAAVVPGDLKASELIQRIISTDPEERMPPAKSIRKLNAKQIELLKRWVAQGAPWGKHWAFQTPIRPALAEVSNKEWPRNGIDHFILARLDKEKLKPADQAKKETLIRRVSLDLTGLPPSLDQIKEFLADASTNPSNAYEKVVDRLLASPRYGEHMTVAWLDAARYADTDGYQNDRYRYQWVWRDWVIRAINLNQPFDQFVTEQLAGDMLENPTLYQQIATGFGRNHRINSEAGSIPTEWHVENVADRVDTFGTMFLGLTIGCARCHQHKYDPIEQSEYYRLFAYFNTVQEWGIGPNNGNSPPFIKVPKSWPNLSEKENKLIVPAALAFQGKGQFSGGVVRPKPGGTDTVMVMHEQKEPRPTYLLMRGLYDQPDKSKKLAPGVPASIDTVKGTVGKNRLELARWLVHPKNPLLARVTINRYWQQFFGVGLVRTSENFGAQGQPPSHPRLLDWLATEFIERKWNVKAMHKLIVMSATYRQSSQTNEQLSQRDPENRLLARGPRFQLTAQMVRDQALLVSGLLVEQVGGRSVKPYMPPAIWKSISNNRYKQDKGDALYRRSLYTYWRRTIPPPTMMAFNAAEREVCIVRKDRTITPLQALTLMNNITFVEASRFMAERMIKQDEQGGKNFAAQVAHGFQLATSRLPDPSELALMLSAHDKFLKQFRANGKAAEQFLSVGQKPRDKQLDSAEHAAMTMIASTILNMDEVINKE